MLENFGFEKHLKSWTCISYHKNRFSNVSTEKFSRFFKKSVSSRFNRSRLSFDWSKRQKKILIFRLKLLGLLDSFPIPFDQLSLFFSDFPFLPNSSRPIEFHFFKTNRNQISLLHYSLSFSLIPLFFFFFFFFSFCVLLLVKDSKVFF